MGWISWATAALLAMTCALDVWRGLQYRRLTREMKENTKATEEQVAASMQLLSVLNQHRRVIDRPSA